MENDVRSFIDSLQKQLKKIDYVKPEDILVKSGQYLVEASKNLDNAMVIAMQNGYSIQDVCNIKLAEQAYKASAYVFKTAGEISTFELDV